MKICAKCNETKELSEFSKDSKKPDGLFRDCKSCKKKSDSENYKKNKVKLLERNKAQREKRRESLRDLKNVPCADCKNCFPYYVMDFDHVTGDKFGGVSRMVVNYGMEKLLEEVDKCEVVCANCHRIRTFNRSVHVDVTQLT